MIPNSMHFNMIDFIEEKKLGRKNHPQKINEFVEFLVNDKIPDYQVSAWLMAVRLNGMDIDEITALTNAMAQSGAIFDLSEFKNTADKHSTGGVGDTTTLIVAPLVSAAGVTVVKFSGRSLDFTGGTLDKLESIPRFRTDLKPEEIIKQARKIGLVIAGTSSDMVPADKILYSLRDATCTVDSVPLIASSVMSKKIAGGAKNIVLDVKFGDGAFMCNFDDARELARIMVSIANNLGRNARAVLSSMDSPLGKSVGNALEVMEAINALKGNCADDLMELSLILASEMVSLARGHSDISSIKKELEILLKTGKALEKFEAMIKEQGGDVRVIDDYGVLPHASFRFSFNASMMGFIRKIKAREIGNLVRKLGGGRFKKDGVIDPSVGVSFFKKPGDEVSEGDRIVDVHYNKANEKDMIESALMSAIEIGGTKPERVELVREII